jgi:hypothetical protein
MDATRAVQVALLLATGAAISLLLVGNRHLAVGVSLFAIVVPVITWVRLAHDEQAGRPGPAPLVIALILALLALAVSLPPGGSHDVWSYVMYGRIFEHYHVSPYTHVPRDFPHDPFYRLVGWRETPSVYGPAFVAVAALGSALAGNSVLDARLFHQLLTASAIGVACFLIWRRTKSPAALALLGLNPLVVVSVVNGAHNDALVGLAILGAALLVEDDRWRAAGVVLALGALVKVTALLALPALALFAAHRRGRRAASTVVTTTAAAVAVGYAVAGPAAIRALGATRGLMTRTSVWRLPRLLLTSNGGVDIGETRLAWTTVFTLLGFAAIAATAVVVAWRRRAAGHPSDAVTFALGAYLVVAVYVLPWYAVWAIPIACYRTRRATAALVAGLSAYLLAAYTLKERALPGLVGPGWSWLNVSVGPLVALVAFFVVALGTDRPVTAV